MGTNRQRAPQAPKNQRRASRARGSVDMVSSPRSVSNAEGAGGIEIQLGRPAPHAGRAGYAEGEAIGGARAGPGREGLAEEIRAAGSAAWPPCGSGGAGARGRTRMVLLPSCSRQAAQPGWTLYSAPSTCAGAPGWTADSAISILEILPA